MSGSHEQIKYYLRYPPDSLDFARFNEVKRFYLLDNGAYKLDFSTAFWRSATFFYLLKCLTQHVEKQ